MKELDLVAVNVLSLAAANAAVVYLVSPTRAAPAPGRWEWQNALARLPNNVFEGSLPQRAVTGGARVAGFLAKSAELCGVGVLAGARGAAAARELLCTWRRAQRALLLGGGPGRRRLPNPPPLGSSSAPLTPAAPAPAPAARRRCTERAGPGGAGSAPPRRPRLPAGHAGPCAGHRRAGHGCAVWHFRQRALPDDCGH